MAETPQKDRWLRFDAWVERLLFALALLSAALPVLVVKGVSQPFITPRELLLRTIAAGALPLLVVYWGRRLPKGVGMVGAAVLLLLVTGLGAVLFSQNPAVSFWGNAERLTGWLTWAEVAVFGAVVYTVFLRPAQRTVLLGVWGASWAGVALWGIAERIIPGFWAQFNGGGGRSAGTFGNPIFLANSVLAAAAVFLPVALAWRLPRKRLVAAFIVAVLAGWCILYTETRGAYVGLVLGGMAAMAAVGVWARRPGVRMVSAGVPLLLCAGVLGVWLMRTQPVVAMVAGWHPFLSRAVSIFNGNDPSQRQRFELWSIAVDAVRARPFFGWGPEQFDTALDRLYRPHFTVYDVANSYSDRAHNTVLDVAVAGGLIGLGAYLFLFAAIAGRVVRAKRQHLLSAPVAAVALGGGAAYVATLLTAFETTGTLLNLAFGAALLCAVSRIPAQPELRPVLPQRWWYAAGGLLALAGVWLVGATVLPVARAAHAVHVAVTTASGNDLLAAADLVRAIPQPYRPQYEVRVANEIFKAVGGGGHPGRAVPRDALLRQAETLMRDARVGLPNHFGTQMMFANILLLQAAYGLVDIGTAITEIEHARTLAPNRQVTYFQIGNAYLVADDPERAHDAFEAAFAMDPLVPEAAWHAARGRAMVGDVAGAAPLFTQAWRGGFGDNRPDPELVLAINTMIASDDLPLVQEMYREWVQRPDAPAARWASYAAVAATNGHADVAIRALKQALLLDPSLASEVPAFLEQYGLPPDALSAPASDS